MHVMTPNEAIADLRRQYIEACNAGDVDAVVALHTSDSIHLPAGMAPVIGRAAIRELMRTSLRAMPRDLGFDFEAIDTRIADGWAVERGVTWAMPPFPTGKYVMLYELEPDGRWRIGWTITNHDAPFPSA
jgi:uncharacterized protein (TIGR02246 family)